MNRDFLDAVSDSGLTSALKYPGKTDTALFPLLPDGLHALMERSNLTHPTEVPKMKELDCVEVIVEKKRYADVGIHRGMHGWICDERKIDGRYLVNFPQYGENEDIATLDILESDLLKIPVMDARINERIRRQYKGIRR